MTEENKQHPTLIPTRLIGPLLISGEGLQQELIKVPLATYETTLWPSTHRGAKISRLCGGINSQVISEMMTRSLLMQADNASDAYQLSCQIQQSKPQLAEEIAKHSRFARLQNIHIEQLSHMLYIRLECSSGDAAGHNMTTKAAGNVLQWLKDNIPQLKYVSISANYCSDKKASAINGICGRGKRTIAEINIPRNLCEKYLRATPEEIVQLHIKKNLYGSILAGSIRSANAHFSNLLLATYLATGQDAANIVEASQGITYAEVRADMLYFSVTCPNLIVGTVGNGKTHPHVLQHLENMKCADPAEAAGKNSRRLAAIIAATILCGELSLLAALTHPDELMRAHEIYERGQATNSTA